MRPKRHPIRRTVFVDVARVSRRLGCPVLLRCSWWLLLLFAKKIVPARFRGSRGSGRNGAWHVPGTVSGDDGRPVHEAGSVSRVVERRLVRRRTVIPHDEIVRLPLVSIEELGLDAVLRQLGDQVAALVFG